jgi:hypothetical protein
MSSRSTQTLTALSMVISCASGAVSCRGSAPPTIDPLPVRPLEQAMAEVGSVRIGGVKPADIDALCVTPEGDLFVADSVTKTVSMFAENGSFVRRFGGPGETPGRFTVPWVLTVDGLGRAHVLDIKQSRIHVFGADGGFDHAVSFAASGIMGQDLVVDGRGQIYLGGYQRARPTDPTRPTVHRLGRDGRILGSFYPLDPRSDDLNLRRVAGVRLALGTANTIYAAQVTGPDVVHFRPTGDRVGVIGGPSAIYREPLRMPSPNVVRSKEWIDQQFARWTQLVGLITGPDDEMLVVYSAHNPVKYALNIYKSGVLVMEGIGTNHQPVAWRPDGRIIFMDTTGPELTLRVFAPRALIAAR